MEDDRYSNYVYLYYYEDENLIRDEDGNIIYDIYRLVSPQDIYMFKTSKQGYVVFNTKLNTIFELIYPDNDDYFN